MTGNLRSLPLSWSLLFVFVFQFQWFVVNVLVVQDFAYIVWIFFKRILCLNHSNLSWSWSLFELHFQVIRAIAIDANIVTFHEIFTEKTLFTVIESASGSLGRVVLQCLKEFTAFLCM